MFSFRTTPIEDQLDHALTEGRVSVFCTQNCWNPSTGEYLYETLRSRGNLEKVAMPSGGEFFSGASHIDFDQSFLEDCDAVVVEIQDVGVRWFGYTRDVCRLLSMRARMENGPAIYIVDHINPAGRLVEGSMPAVNPGIWTPKVPHRYGLTLGELCTLYYEQIDARFPLHIISARCSDVGKDLLPWTVPPSADIAGMFTCEMYCGSSLWEDTSISPATGTPRSYEYFGAPFIRTGDVSFLPTPAGVMMRPCCFVPSGGEYAGQQCFGYQTMLRPGVQYHSLLHTLLLMRYFADRYSLFQMRDSLFEKISDPVMEEYLRGRLTFDVVQEHVKTEEQKWIRKARKFLLYDNSPCRIK